MFCHSCRITPAGAGKTEFARREIAASGDHPRRCGENALTDGSDEYARRITPAGAGKTKPGTECAVYSTDHPRRCG